MSSQPQRAATEIRIVALVSKVRDHPQGSFAVTYPVERTGFSIPQEIGKEAVTFTVAEAWQDEFEPQAGQLVVLSGLRLFEKGWRALSARPIRLRRES